MKEKAPIFLLVFLVVSFVLYTAFIGSKLAERKDVQIVRNAPLSGAGDVRWKGAGATSTRIGIGTATTTVLRLNLQRSFAKVCHDTTSTGAYFSCEYAQDATLGEGETMYSPGNTTSSNNCLTINNFNPWFGQLTCVGNANASATLVEY